MQAAAAISEQAPSRVPARVVVLYSLPSFGLSALTLVFYTYLLKFYSDNVGFGLGFLSALVLAIRVWDAVIDPVIGSLSDRTMSRFGRRRPWIALAALPMAMTFWLLLNPGRAGGTAQVSTAFSAFLFFLFLSCVTIPYEALGAELSPDYDDRNRLLGAREGAGLAGMVAGALAPSVLAVLGWQGTEPEDTRARFSAMGLTLAAVSGTLCLVTAASLKERTIVTAQRPRETWWPDWTLLTRNRPFRLLLFAFTLVQIGIGISTALYSFFNEHVLAHSNGDLFLGAYLLVGLASVPMWVFAARRWEKRVAWQAAMILCTVSFALVLLLGAGDAPLFLALILISALGLGGILAIPPSMQADTIDLDEMQSGVRREGQFLGLWYIVRKGAQALSAAGAFAVLGAAGYVSGGAEQSTGTLRTLSVLYAGVPCLCYALAVFSIQRYDLGRARHQAVLSAMADRRLQATHQGQP